MIVLVINVANFFNFSPKESNELIAVIHMTCSHNPTKVVEIEVNDHISSNDNGLHIQDDG